MFRSRILSSLIKQPRTKLINNETIVVNRLACTQAVAQYEAINEKVLTYERNSVERRDLDNALNEYMAKETEVPICIGDEEVKCGDALRQVYPFDHRKSLSTFYYANDNILNKAIKVALESRDKWERTPFHERAKIFLKAADLISTKYRPHLVATTMLGQSKTIYQAEIDAAAELVDFIRFNIHFASKILKYKPIDVPNVTNTVDWRGMEGFWSAISPFNFTAIGGNLAIAPAIMGNVVLWKATDSAILSNFTIYKILRECGLPPGVINFVTSDGPTYGKVTCLNPNLAGINFTGSVKTFRTLYEMVGVNINNYTSYPRLIGECGGKNFHFVHESADLDNVSISTVRSAFEYGGQKCSACSRLYVPESKWPELKKKLIDILNQVKVDSPLIRDTFYSAVIDNNAFKRIKSYIDYAKSNNKLSIEYGGKCDDSVGYYVHPTIIRTSDPNDKIIKEEIFGPILAVYVYPDSSVDKTLELVDKTTDYGLTGAVFAKDPKFIDYATHKLRHSTGNFYVNVQSTGSVVGQQPFGGARLSGTNDKAGGPFYLLKFASPLSIKFNTGPVISWKQAHME